MTRKPDRYAFGYGEDAAGIYIKLERAPDTATAEALQAHGRLIAAAPQMLTALKAAWFAIDPETHPDQNRMVRAAIDAAEGAGR